MIISLVIVSCAQEEEKSPIEGVWQISEYTFNSPDTSWTSKSPQPSLWVFGKEYYSMMYVYSIEPRPLFPDDYTRNTLTDEQIRSSFMTFIANSGKFELDGSKFIVYPIVALEPNYMTNSSTEYEYKIEGDTMESTRVSITGSIRYYKLVRLE